MHHTQCLYLTAANGEPMYIGVCEKSVFGGLKRYVAGRDRSPRYGTSYEHWIEGFLQEGGELYIGKCDHVSPGQLKCVEDALLAFRMPKFNKRKGRRVFQLRHVGDVPEYLRA